MPILTIQPWVREIQLPQILAAISELEPHLAKEGMAFYERRCSKIPKQGCLSCREKRIAAQMRVWLVAKGGEAWQSGTPIAASGAKQA